MPQILNTSLFSAYINKPHPMKTIKSSDIKDMIRLALRTSVSDNNVEQVVMEIYSGTATTSTGSKSPLLDKLLEKYQI